jgi:hypothetical protein
MIGFLVFQGCLAATHYFVKIMRPGEWGIEFLSCIRTIIVNVA